MRDFGCDAEGKALTSKTCEAILESVKVQVKEAMSLMAVSKMLLQDAKAPGPACTATPGGIIGYQPGTPGIMQPGTPGAFGASSMGSEGFPAMGSGGAF